MNDFRRQKSFPISSLSPNLSRSLLLSSLRRHQISIQPCRTSYRRLTIYKLLEQLISEARIKPGIGDHYSLFDNIFMTKVGPHLSRLEGRLHPMDSTIGRKAALETVDIIY